MIKNIRWIASYPKSGNTWVKLFLAAYQFPDDFSLQFKAPNQCQDTLAPFYDQCTPRDVADLTHTEQFLIRPAALYLMQFGAGGDPVYVKTHCAFVQVDGMPVIPAAVSCRALYIVRDPRDVAVSLADHLGKGIDHAIKVMGSMNVTMEKDGISQIAASWSKNVSSWHGQRKVDQLMVKYEDMLADPVKQFADIARFLLGEVDLERVKKAVERTAFEVLQTEENRDGYAGRVKHQKNFFRQGTSGGWALRLTVPQVQRIETEHAAVMRICNYQLEGLKEIA